MLLPSAEAPAVYSDKNLLAIVKKKRERTMYDGKRALFFSFPFPSSAVRFFLSPGSLLHKMAFCRGESFHAEITLTTLAFGGFLPGWIIPPSVCLVLHSVQLGRGYFLCGMLR